MTSKSPTVASQACLFREDRRAEGYHSMIMSGARMWLKDPFAPCEYIAFADMPLATCWGMWPFEFGHRGLPVPSPGRGAVLLWAGRGRQAGDVELWSEEPGRMVLLDDDGAPKAPLTTASVSRIGKVPAGPVDPTKARSILIINPATHRDLYGIPRPVPEEPLRVAVTWSPDHPGGRVTLSPWLWRIGLLPERPTDPLAPGFDIWVSSRARFPLAIRTSAGWVHYDEDCPRDVSSRIHSGISTGAGGTSSGAGASGAAAAGAGSSAS